MRSHAVELHSMESVCSTVSHAETQVLTVAGRHRLSMMVGSPTSWYAVAHIFPALETLGLEGWNWKNMLHYFKKVCRIFYTCASMSLRSPQSETLIAPESAQEATLLKLDPAAHGTSGPIIVAPPTQISSVHLPFLHGFKELGFPTNYDSVSRP